MWKRMKTSAVVLAGLTLATGVLYPLTVTVIARLVFPLQANGSLVERGGRVVGSTLIGQPFDGPGEFWSRPSATSSGPYNAASSAGSNLGPTHPELVTRARTRIAALRAADPTDRRPIPVDLVTASGSGLDPHITPAAALYQAPRVARARGLAVARVVRLVEDHTEGPWLGFLGEPRVNVLELNLALDALR